MRTDEKAFKRWPSLSCVGNIAVFVTSNNTIQIGEGVPPHKMSNIRIMEIERELVEQIERDFYKYE